LENWLRSRRDLLLLFILRIALVGVQLNDIRDESYSTNSPSIPSGTLQSQQVQFIYAQQEAASQHTDDKIKQLLTLSSSFATFLLAIGGTGYGRLLLFPLAAVVLLCISALAVRTGSLPELSASEGDRNSQVWARDVMRAVQVNRGSHFYRVDLYRGARRWFLVTVFMMPIILVLQHTDLNRVLKHVDALFWSPTPVVKHASAVLPASASISSSPAASTASPKPSKIPSVVSTDRVRRSAIPTQQPTSSTASGLERNHQP
jgi:hypothetical protein